MVDFGGVGLRHETPPEKALIGEFVAMNEGQGVMVCVYMERLATGL